MKRLLDDLLDVSRVSQGKIQLRKEPLELGALLLQAVDVSRPMIVEKRQELSLTLAPGPLPLEADPTRLVQVFANLLNNAAKYTDEGGHIALTVKTEDGEAVVRVRDDGMGMSSGAPRAGLRPVRAGDALPRPRAGRAGDRSHHGPDDGQDARRIGASVERGARPRQRVRREPAARARGRDARGSRCPVQGRGSGRSAARPGGRRQRGRRACHRVSARDGRTSSDGRLRRRRRPGGCGQRAARPRAARHRAARHGWLRGRRAAPCRGPHARHAGGPLGLRARRAPAPLDARRDSTTTSSSRSTSSRSRRSSRRCRAPKREGAGRGEGREAVAGWSRELTRSAGPPSLPSRVPCAGSGHPEARPCGRALQQGGP